MCRVPANASTVDSAEYVLVPQSAAPTFGASSAFALRAVTLGPRRCAWLKLCRRPRGRRRPPFSLTACCAALGASTPHARAPPCRAPSPEPPGSSPPPHPRRSAVSASSRYATTRRAAAHPPTLRLSAPGPRSRAHVAIYVDTLAPSPGLDSADVDTLRQVFDTLLYPLDSANFGPVSDLDANGVVIALMTPVVNALTTKAACSTSGYIAGFFFPADLTRPRPAFPNE